jgi:hypothetical protein
MSQSLADLGQRGAAAQHARRRRVPKLMRPRRGGDDTRPVQRMPNDGSNGTLAEKALDRRLAPEKRLGERPWRRYATMATPTSVGSGRTVRWSCASRIRHQAGSGSWTPGPGSGRPNARCSAQRGRPSVRRRRSTACGPPTTRGCVAPERKRRTIESLVTTGLWFFGRFMTVTSGRAEPSDSAPAPTRSQLITRVLAKDRRYRAKATAR